MRKCYWDINEAKVIIDAYKSVESISEEEFIVMKIMLQFPQKFWRVVNKYYNSRRCWRDKTFEKKLLEVIDEIEYHKKFLDNYNSLY
jgi:MinD superfamily P-loop ATPase